MLLELVPESKVDSGAFLGGGPNEVSHDARGMEGQIFS